MTIEFTRAGKTYECSLLATEGPPPTVRILIRPCVLRPPVELELRWLCTDDVRGIELYQPVREVR